ncbi:MAG: LpxI family protein, partial [Gemmataceae bacterium]
MSTVPSTPQPVGLIAGAGRFPIVFAEKARECGIPVVCVGIAGMADPALASICTEFVWLRRMSISFVIRSFRRGGARQFTMAGKFYKNIMFRPWRWLQLLPDWRTFRLWYRRTRSDRRDDSMLLAVIEEFRS